MVEKVLFKLLLVGESAVGKSSILLRYMDGKFEGYFFIFFNIYSYFIFKNPTQTQSELTSRSKKFRDKTQM